MSNQRVINLLLLRGLMMSVILGKGCDGWVFELPRKLMTRESPEVVTPFPSLSLFFFIEFLIINRFYFIFAAELSDSRTISILH